MFSFSHPPTPPCLKAMLLEDLDMQIMSPREPETTLQIDEHPGAAIPGALSTGAPPQLPRAPVSPLESESTTGSSEEAHVDKLTIENLQLHQQDQRYAVLFLYKSRFDVVVLQLVESVWCDCSKFVIKT